MEVNQKIPQLGIVVEIEEIFMHFAKAFKRSNLWSSSNWPERESIPSMAGILNDHIKMEEFTIKNIDNSLADSYSKRLY
jgi:hypothetical protein